MLDIIFLLCFFIVRLKEFYVFMANFDIRTREDMLDCVNNVLNNGGIAEIKIERHTTPVVVEIKRQKKIPPKENK